MIILFSTGVFAIKCIIGAVAQACFYVPIPTEVVLLAGGFELIFEYFSIKVFLKRM